MADQLADGRSFRTLRDKRIAFAQTSSTISMENPDRITILHVSDFHFTERKHREQDYVVKALLADIRTLCIGHRKPDLIVFSGDLTQGPPGDEHTGAYDKLLDPLLQATKATVERLFSVAGNRDVQREAIVEFKSELENWRFSSNDMNFMNAAFEAGLFDAAHAKKFQNYLELESYISGETAVFRNDFCSVQFIAALNTNVVTVNSSMLSAGGQIGFEKDEGKFIIPEFAVSEAWRTSRKQLSGFSLCTILNRSGFISFKSCGHGCFVQHGVILIFSFGWRYIADGLQKLLVVEPVDPFQGGEFHHLEAPPRSTPMDDLGPSSMNGIIA